MAAPSAAPQLTLDSIRQQYPQYKDWSDERMTNAIENKHAAEKAQKKTQGMSGVGRDMVKSVKGTPEAAVKMISQVASGAWAGAKNIVNHPINSLMDLPAGIGEGMIAMERIPGNVAGYRADKGMMSKKDAETYKKYQIPEDLGIEKMLGIDKGKGNNFIKALASYLIPGKLAKLALPGKIAKVARVPATMATVAAGQNEDPLQAALMGIIGEHLGKKGLEVVKKIPGAVNRAAGVPPGDVPPGGSGGVEVPPADNITPPDDLPPPGGSVGGVAPPPAAPPAGINLSAHLPDSVSWVQNIPEATKNVAKALPKKVKAKAKAIKKAIPEVAGSAAASALETTADYASKIPVVGGIAQPTLGAAAAAIKHYSVAPETVAKRKLFGDIEPGDLAEMQERDAAGKRLDLTYNTIPELLGSPYESVKQASVGRTTKGMKELYKRGQERESSEGAAIDKLTDLVHEDKLNPVKKAAYEDTMKRTLPPEFIDAQTKRPVIQKAMKAVVNDTAYKQMLQEEYGVDDVNKVPANSFMFWDMVKRVLYDMEKREGRKGGDTKPDVYANTRRSMVAAMDLVAPKYAEARSISERGFTKDAINDVFNKKDRNFNVFNDLLKDKKKYAELVRKLAPFPEALQQLKDIKVFAGNMIPNNPNIRAAAALKRLGMSDARNKVEAQKRELDEKYGQEHDVAAVKLMTHPDLMKKLTEHLKEKGK